MDHRPVSRTCDTDSAPGQSWGPGRGQERGSEAGWEGSSHSHLTQGIGVVWLPPHIKALDGHSWPLIGASGCAVKGMSRIPLEPEPPLS